MNHVGPHCFIQSLLYVSVSLFLELQIPILIYLLHPSHNFGRSTSRKEWRNIIICKSW